MQNKPYQIASFLVLMLLLGLSTSSLAQTPTLVYDINNGFDPSSPSNFAVFNGKLYFGADDGSSGMELWVYDGVNNPSRVADINSGSGGSDPQGLIVFDSKLYFAADSGSSGKELWVYTGTGSPSMVSGTGDAIQSLDPEFIVYKSALYFAAYASATGSELYKYTGTGSPSIVYDIQSGSGSGEPYSFCIYKDSLYFGADNGSIGPQLWRYSGTGNPSLVKRIGSGSFGSAPNFLTVMGSKLYFSADDGVRGTELWSWDDTDTAMLGDIYPGSGGSMPEHLTVYNNVLYFAADDGTNGAEFWKYTGTGSPSMVANIYTGTFNASFPSDFTVYNDTLYFTASDGTNGSEPRKYGGGSGTTSVILVDDIQTGSFGSFAMGYIKFGSSLYFLADDGVKGGELWKMTATCTPILDTLTVTACDTFVFNGTTYFMSNNTAKDTITGTGCDTIRTLNLTVNYSSFPVDSFITECDSFTLFGITYTDSTIVDTVFTNSTGCDSLVTFYININKSSSKDSFITACNSYTLFGQTYTSSTVVDSVYTNAVGCDSLVRYYITIYYSANSTINITACDSYTRNGITYTSSTKVDSISTNSNGCEDTTTFNITINNSFNRDTFVSLCGNSFNWRGTTHNNSTTDKRTFQTSNGCDSTITLHLTLGKPTFNYINRAACYDYFWRGTVYDETGLYADTIPNSTGCDSILILDLTINEATYSDTFASACGGYFWRGKGILGNGVIYDTTVNAAGCDSIVRLNFTALYPSYGETMVVQCGDSAQINGFWYHNSGTYKQTLTAATGCDSILTINYMKDFGNNDTTRVTTCQQSYIIGNKSYNASGYYVIEIDGCDTTVLDLTLSQTKDTLDWYIRESQFSDRAGHTIVQTSQFSYSADFIDVEIRNGKGVKFRNFSFDRKEFFDQAKANAVNDTAYDVLLALNMFKFSDEACITNIRFHLILDGDGSKPITTIHACDTVRIGNSLIHYSFFKTTAAYKPGKEFYNFASSIATGSIPYKVYFYESVTVNKNTMSCQPVVVGDKTFTSSGDYTVVLETENGCDSTVNITYTKLDRDTAFSISVCDSYTLNDITYTTSGIYKQPVPGCNLDTITINLTIRQSSTPINDTISACISYTWQDSTYTESTTDMRTYTNAVGCDSVRNLILTIHQPDTTIDSISACLSYTWQGVTYTTGGTYKDTLTNIHGCDSFVTLELEIIDRNTFPRKYLTNYPRYIIRGPYYATLDISDNGEYLAYMDIYDDDGYEQAEVYLYKKVNDKWVSMLKKPKLIQGSEIFGISTDKATLKVANDGTILASYFTAGASWTVLAIQDRTEVLRLVNDSTYEENGVSFYSDVNLNEPKYAVADLSADGNTIVIGSPRDPLKAPNFLSHAQVYTYNGTAWVPKGLPLSATRLGRQKGSNVSISADGNRVVITGSTTVNTADTIEGDVIVYDWDGTKWNMFGNRLIDILQDSIENGTYNIYATAINDSNVMAVTREGAKQILIYTYSSSSFKWEANDTINLENKVGSDIFLEISDDGTMISLNNRYGHGDLYSYNATGDSFAKHDFKGLPVQAGKTITMDEKSKTIYFVEQGLIRYLIGERNDMILNTFQLCNDDQVGIEEIAYSTNKQGVSFTVYPNPSTGVFTLRVDVPESMQNNPMQYEVYNMQGMVVRQGTLSSAEGTINLEGQPQGIYFVKFQIGGYTGTAKILITN